MGKISINKTIGKSTFSFWIDEKDFKEGLAKAAFYATTPDKCTVCGKEEVTLDSNKTQEGYLYVKVRCLNESCKAQATLGEYRDGSGGFWKAFEKYEPKDGSPSESAPKKETKKTKKTEKKSSDGEEEGYPF